MSTIKTFYFREGKATPQKFIPHSANFEISNSPFPLFFVPCLFLEIFRCLKKKSSPCISHYFYLALSAKLFCQHNKFRRSFLTKFLGKNSIKPNPSNSKICSRTNSKHVFNLVRCKSVKINLTQPY